MTAVCVGAVSLRTSTAATYKYPKMLKEKGRRGAMLDCPRGN